MALKAGERSGFNDVVEERAMVERRVWWTWCAAAAVALIISAGAEGAWAAGALADPEARKAAIKCQTLIAKTTAKALATKLKAYNGCAAAALACVQTKVGKPDCGTKAAATC